MTQGAKEAWMRQRSVKFLEPPLPTSGLFTPSRSLGLQAPWFMVLADLRQEGRGYCQSHRCARKQVSTSGTGGKVQLTARPGSDAGAAASLRFWMSPQEERHVCLWIRHWHLKPPLTRKERIPSNHMATFPQLHNKFTGQSIRTKRLS